jgi:hypothetical protein
MLTPPSEEVRAEAREFGFNLVNELNEKCGLIDLEGNNLGFDVDEAYSLAEQRISEFMSQQRAEAALAEHKQICPFCWQSVGACKRGAALAKEAQG